MCLFARTPVFGDLGIVAELANSLHGLNITEEDIRSMAKDLLRIEEEFNQKAGLKSKRFHEFMYKEKLPPHNTVFDVAQDELESLKF